MRMIFSPSATDLKISISLCRGGQPSAPTCCLCIFDHHSGIRAVWQPFRRCGSRAHCPAPISKAGVSPIGTSPINIRYAQSDNALGAESIPRADSISIHGGAGKIRQGMRRKYVSGSKTAQGVDNVHRLRINCRRRKVREQFATGLVRREGGSEDSGMGLGQRSKVESLAEPEGEGDEIGRQPKDSESGGCEQGPVGLLPKEMLRRGQDLQKREGQRGTQARESGVTEHGRNGKDNVGKND